MPAEGTEHRKLAAIMFTDMVGYSALTQRNEALALEVLAAQGQLLRPIFPKHQGREVKSTGDGFLVEFASALAAVQCAMEIQKAVVQHNAASAPDGRFHIRIGVHLGDVVYREADMFGDGVNIAARIEPLAEAGGICLSGPVVDQIQNKVDVPLVRLSQPELKNIQVPIDVYRLVLPWQAGGQAADTKRRARQRPKSNRPVFALLTALFVLALAGLWLPGGWSRLLSKLRTSFRQTVPQSLAAPGRITIGVATFANRSPDAADAYLSEAVTDEILNALTRVSGFRVIPARDQEVRGRAAELGVQHLLDGSVMKAKDQLRISVKLQSLADSSLTWSDQYDYAMTNILPMRSEVAQHVAAALQVKLAVGDIQQLDKRPTDNPEAYRLYLRGRAYWNEVSEAGFLNSIKYFSLATNVAPQFALAYAGLADAWIQLGDGEYLAPQKAFGQAQEFVSRALELDSTLGEAYVSRGTIRIFYTREWAEAGDDFSQALKLAPRYGDLYHFYGHYLEILGRTNEALASFQHGVELDPGAAMINTEYAWSLYKARRFDEAIQQCQKVAITQNNPWAHLLLAIVYNHTGKHPEALEQVEQVRSVPAQDTTLAVAEQGYALARLGRTNEAVEMLDEAQAVANKKHGYLDPYFLAMIHLGLNHDDQTVKFLNEAVDNHSLWVTFAKVEPRFDRLRGHRSFAKLLERMRLPP